MDVKQILDRFNEYRGPLAAVLQHGPGPSEVEIRKIGSQEIIIFGGYIPELDAVVKILVDAFAVEGVVVWKNDVRGAIRLLRPLG